ncbi:hypothetical protein LPJ61_001215 [Coemansia biformis]|uniref:Uncharacterized protein n=1 Tax=Coemansia biformis TaxID=1286918 RepID=A0A9W7YFK5_9FUNG|nr:hypothetical protein LPJ61_001215 [Coemansia biformis]
MLRVLIVWGSGETAETICNVWPVMWPIRILGNYLTPDGSVKEMALLAHERVDNLLRIIWHHYITDQMVQYVVRAIIIPMLEYCLLGIPFTEDELQKVCTLVMIML